MGGWKSLVLRDFCEPGIMLLGLAGVLLLYMRKLIEDAEFQGMWISSDILRLLEYSFAFWGRQDIVLLSWAILCVLRRRADTGAFASGHSAATTDKPFNQLLSVQS